VYRRRGLRTAFAIAAAVLVALGAASALFLRFRPAPPGGYLTVTFVLEAPEARSVAVVGDFTDWRSEGYELARRGNDGAWTITLRLRRDATYTYCFLVDGQEWIPDPRAPETVDDGFGGVDSVLRL
jgi:1,4-alpha-glucan branching enzyme